MTGFSKRVRELVDRRAGGMCERCGCAAPAYQFHHRRPRGMGGSSRADTNTAANCLLLCVPCHSHVEGHRDEALVQGWLVRQSDSPSAVPVFRFGRLSFLDNDGGVTA